MGNTLDKPSLLMRKQFIRSTTTNDENAKKGSEYTNLVNKNAEMAGEAYTRAAPRQYAEHQQMRMMRGEAP